MDFNREKKLLSDANKEIYASVEFAVASLYKKGTINDKERIAFLTKYLAQLRCLDIEKKLDDYKSLRSSEINQLKLDHENLLSEFKDAHKVIAVIEPIFNRRFEKKRALDNLLDKKKK